MATKQIKSQPFSKLSTLIHNDNHHKGNKRKSNETAPSPNVNLKKKRTAFADITNTKISELDSQKLVQKKKSTKTSNKKVEILVPKDENINTSFDVVEIPLSSQESRISSSQESNSPNTTINNLKNLCLSQDTPKEKEISLDWTDVDFEHINDPFHMGLYAADIFQYYKEREEKFRVKDYMSLQSDITPQMRAILVDWLVEVQENFELNHETLYLAVKLVDLFLSKVKVSRDRLQMYGAAALFVACKFDERSPPVLDDFLYICDDAYSREELISTERKILRTIGFDLGAPLSYRFLRRYARCAKSTLETLTLARYILETSLTDYSFCRVSESELGAAALLLAMKMKNSEELWSDTLVHYTGCTTSELTPLVIKLNTMISSTPDKQLTTIKNKYSHAVFHQVALLPKISHEKLVNCLSH